jgi:hypothetical protein
MGDPPAEGAVQQLTENHSLSSVCHLFFGLRLHLTFALTPTSDLRGRTHCKIKLLTIDQHVASVRIRE